MASDTVTGASLNACASDYWYIWVFSSISMLLITVADVAIAYYFLKKNLNPSKVSSSSTDLLKTQSNGNITPLQSLNGSSEMVTTRTLTPNSINPLVESPSKGPITRLFNIPSTRRILVKNQ